MNKASSAVGFGGAPRRLLGELPGLAPALVLALALACVLVPLPQLLVDLLLSGSLAFAVLLLVAALRVDVPAKFSAFPRLLLLVTAFRLVLNLATTRLILSEGDAGRVIESFAGFVTRGDLIVGAVMFGIVTAIQYLVIARGTERVAEVAARFALDGMPGRQAAIAADLQSGVISAAEAARRRATLDRRSDFYGAMDGAVKFVKGDALVGLVIVGVNLIGGLAVGVGRMDYSLVESLSLYGRLTIGDGLLAQIPAVLVSLAAGVLVSRIEEAKDAPTKAWLSPAMLLVPAALLLGVGLVPGMPTLPFVVVGLTLVGAAWVATARSTEASAAPDNLELVLRLPEGALGDPARSESTLNSLHAQCEAATGIALPALRIESTAAGASASLWWGQRPMGSASIAAGEAGEVAWLGCVYRLVTQAAPDLVNLGTLDSELQALARSADPSGAVAVRVALARLTLPEILELLRASLRAGLPLAPLARMVAVLAEQEVFADRARKDEWFASLREASARDWLPPLLEAHERIGHTRFLRCTSDLVLAIESVTRREQGRWRCTLDLARRRRAQAVLLGGVDASGESVVQRAAPCLILSTRGDCERLTAFFADAQVPVRVLALAEFESAGYELPRSQWIDERGFDEALHPPNVEPLEPVEPIQQAALSSEPQLVAQPLPS